MSNQNGDVKFDLERLAVPLPMRRGGGKTTSDGVTLISNQEFHKKDVLIYCFSDSVAVKHSKILEDIALKMGFTVNRKSQLHFTVDGRNIYHSTRLLRYNPVEEKEGIYFLSSNTRELCSQEFFHDYT